MSDVKIIPITPAYRQNYERIFQRQEIEIVRAPFTEEQVDNLETRQSILYLHPYTCGMCSESLTPYRDGWHCDYCHQYKQDWAHKSDTERQETQEDWERPNGGRSYVQRPCKGKHIDDECVHRGCENAEYGCVNQELKKGQR